MGNARSKRAREKEPDRFFEREKWKEHNKEEKKKKPPKKVSRKTGKAAAEPRTPPAPRPAPNSARPYNDEAIERMRYQLMHDTNAFLLNNLLLSVQFFQNFEKEIWNLKNNGTSAVEIELNGALAQHHKHVFSPDRLTECVHEHVRFRENGDPIVAPRNFVIHDNVEANEPGDVSDYSAVLDDAPLYRLLIENTKEPGYVKLRKLEILHEKKEPHINDSTQTDSEIINSIPIDSKASSSRFSDSDSDSVLSDTSSDNVETDNSKSEGEILLSKLKAKLEKSLEKPKHKASINSEMKDNNDFMEKQVKQTGRRPSGLTENMNSVVTKAKLSNISNIKNSTETLTESSSETRTYGDDFSKDLIKTGRRPSGLTKNISSVAAKAKLSNLTRIKSTIVPLSETTFEQNPTGFPANYGEPTSVNISKRKLSGIVKTQTSAVTRGKLTEHNIKKTFDANSIQEDSEISGYHSSSSPQSGAESDYGYSQITKENTPRPLERSYINPLSGCTSKLPATCFTPVEVELSGWSDDESEDEDGEETYRVYLEKRHYLNCTYFMKNFVDVFMTSVGKSLDFSTDEIEEAMTQGASIYCDSVRNKEVMNCEIIPAIIASWPNKANEWIIRQRRIINNPKTNFSYQWPTKYMVNKATGLGCLLIPIGFRPAKGQNSDKILQWRIVFPTAEKYLESCLAHSHVRCYLFTLIAVKSFMEHETAKIGLSSDHIKTHLFWQCEKNYAMWPEDRLGETLRIFLKSLYIQLRESNLPDYFIPEMDHFKGIPKNLLLKLQRKLADILESPVMHMLSAIGNLAYTDKDFYPAFDHMRLYRILTTKNVLRLINPNVSNNSTTQEQGDNSDSENEYKTRQVSFWEQAKKKDKQYMIKKEKQQVIHARKIAKVQAKRRQTMQLSRMKVNPKIIIPPRLDDDRKPLVLELFIRHFISMARCSEKFEATKQGIIFLEQAERLAILLMEDSAGQLFAEDHLSTIRQLLDDYVTKIAKSGAPQVPKRNESFNSGTGTGRKSVTLNKNRLRVQYVNIENIEGQPSPTDSLPRSSSATQVDIHVEPRVGILPKSITLENAEEEDELLESRL